MLDSEPQLLIAIASQIKIAVAPCVEFGCAAQCLSGPGGGCTLFGVVDNDDGNAMLALQLAKKAKKRSDLAGSIFVDAMQADERIEDEQTRCKTGNCVRKRAAIGLPIEPQGGHGDHLDIELFECET